MSVFQKPKGPQTIIVTYASGRQEALKFKSYADAKKTLNKLNSLPTVQQAKLEAKNDKIN